MPSLLPLRGVVTPPPARTSVNAHFATRMAERVAQELGVYCKSLFAPRAGGSGHHPAKHKDPPEVVEGAPSHALLIDDVSTSGETLELCVRALEAAGTRTTAIVWIGGETTTG